MKVKMIVSVLLLALLFLAGVARAAPVPDFDIVRHVIGGGGGRAEQSPYVLNGTLGQSVVGEASQATYKLCAGFWCSPTNAFDIYLPLIVNQDQ